MINLFGMLEINCFVRVFKGGLYLTLFLCLGAYIP